MSDVVFGTYSNEDESITASLLPRVLPAGWRQVGPNCYQHMHEKLSLIISGSRESDGRRWAHVSIANPTRMPTWDELRRVKEWVLGKESRAIQVLPPESEYVNLHRYCLHLWQCLDGDGLPDFRKGGLI